MTKAVIQPGVCGFTAEVTADSEDQMEVTVQVVSGCKAVQAMMLELGDTFDAYEVCFQKPGANLFYEYAQDHFPGHAGCPIAAGITKCIEAECGLALKRNVSITFVEA